MREIEIGVGLQLIGLICVVLQALRKNCLYWRSHRRGALGACAPLRSLLSYSV